MTVHNAISQVRAKNLEAGKHADGQGLWLFKSRKEAGKWILRLVISGKRREMGLGRWPDVSIGEARRRAEDARRQPSKEPSEWWAAVSQPSGQSAV